MTDKFLFVLEFLVNELSIFSFPKDLKTPDELKTKIQFLVSGESKFEVSGEELNPNECKKSWKNCLLKLTSEQVKEFNPEIRISKILNNGQDFVLISEELKTLEKSLKLVGDNYLELKEKSEENSQFPSEFIKELLQLKNGEFSGGLYYSMKICCFGKIKDQETPFIENPVFYKPKDSEVKCLGSSTKVPNNSCTNLLEETDDAYDEYAAEVNGNSLIVRVAKNSHLVTRVYDSKFLEDEDEFCFKTHKNKRITLNQFDEHPLKIRNHCCHGRHLTSFQKQTNCLGDSYQNSVTLPIIRGNQKYPARFNCQNLLKFNFCDKMNSDVSQKYRVHPPINRNVCQQVDELDLTSEKNPKSVKGIEICKKGCADPNTDVFVLKIGKKRNSQDKKSEIELEMRTPKGPDVERKKKETVGCQVIINKFRILTLILNLNNF